MEKGKFALLKAFRFLVYFERMIKTAGVEKRFSCIIFDLDGTLSLTNELIFASFNHIAQRYTGKVFSPSEITAMFGPPEEYAVEHIVGRERLQQAMDEFLKFYDEHHPVMARAHEGMRDILAQVKRHGVVLALFTGKGKHTTMITLKHLGLQQYFDLIVTGHDVQKHKPSSEGIQKVLKIVGLEPQEVLMVGDSVADVNAAHEAGVKIAAVLWDSYSKENILQMEVDYLFYSVAEFGAWLKSLFKASPIEEHA
jgi:HAD superfamily hydrolase (TIGR01509 family)